MRPFFSKTFINSTIELVFPEFISFGENIMEMASFPTMSGKGFLVERCPEISRQVQGDGFSFSGRWCLLSSLV
jgi:hypothetical protein